MTVLVTQTNGDKERRNVRHHVVDFVTMLVVCGLSLAILVYVAEGKAQKTYEQFYRDAAIAQGQMIKNAVESFLRLDLPLQQFAGFKALTSPLVGAKSSISAVNVVDEHGDLVFSSSASGASSAQPVGQSEVQAIANKGWNRDQPEQFIFPLRGKFETVGSLALEIGLTAQSAHLAAAFHPLWALVGVSACCFALMIFMMRDLKWKRRSFWLATTFTVIFVVIAALVTVTLVGLYADGASAKGRAILTSLAGRLLDVTAYKINFEQIEGIDRVFGEQIRLNPDITNIALVVDGICVVDTEKTLIGYPWKAANAAYEYTIDISRPGGLRLVQVAMTMQKDVVYRQIIHSVRNIIALFVASALFAYFSINMVRALQEARNDEIHGSTQKAETLLGLVKPVFFLGIFVEHLNYSFLPQFVENVAKTSGVPTEFTSVPFILYYFCFAMSLMPAERAGARFGPNRLIWGGLFFSAFGLLVLSCQFGFGSIMVARAISGIAQGFFFIGVQDYILQNTDANHRTRGASIIVVGFQGAMIAGMAIGSLMVSQIGAGSVFEIGTAAAMLTAIFALLVLPMVVVKSVQEIDRDTVWRNIALTLRDPEFLRAIMLIGLPAKAVLTGVVLFALPLILTKQGFGQEDVGQITMLYAMTVIAASSWVAARKYRPRSIEIILFCGAMFSGVGLLMTSSLGWGSGIVDLGPIDLSTLLIVAGILLLGVGHGFINAPIITQVSESRIAGQIGSGQVAAIYRLLERAGHTAGPVIVGQIIAYNSSSPLALAWIGGTLIAMGLLFAITSGDKNDELEFRAT